MIATIFSFKMKDLRINGSDVVLSDDANVDDVRAIAERAAKAAEPEDSKPRLIIEALKEAGYQTVTTRVISID